MSADWYPGIRAFCAHWTHAPILQQTFASLRAKPGDDGSLTVVVVLPGGEEVPLAIEPSQLLFGVDREAYKFVLNACREAKAAAPQDEEVA